MKKLVISLLVLLLLASCSSSSTSSDAKEELRVYNVGEYIDKALIQQFEQEHNAKVIYETFDSNESMYTKISAGSVYDILVPSDYMIQRLIEEDFLQKIDYSLIPNASHLMENTKNKHYDPNNEYSIPYFNGDVGIVYNKSVDVNDLEQQGWDIFKNPKYKNRIYIYNSERDAFLIALKALGYSSNSEDPKQLEEAYQWLLELDNTMDPVYVIDEVIDQMIAENKDMAIMYSGDAAYVMTENENLAYHRPKQGTNIWQDAMVIPKNAKNPKLAHAWMNFMLDLDVARQNTEYVGYRTPIKEIYDEMVAPGGTFEGINAYAEYQTEKDEEYYYNSKTKDIISDYWTRVKAN